MSNTKLDSPQEGEQNSSDAKKALTTSQQEEKQNSSQESDKNASQESDKNSSQEIVMSEVKKKKRGRKPKPKPDIANAHIKVKKKRGRKPKPKTAEDLKPKVKKKRGRKPKPKTAEDLKPKVKKKRGRKPKDKYGIVANLITQSLETENDNIILHLPISSSMIEDNSIQRKLMEYKPDLSVPIGYEDETAGCYEIIKNSDSTLQESQIGELPIGKQIKSLNPQPEQIKMDILRDTSPTNLNKLKQQRKEEFDTYKIDNSLYHTMIPFYEANKNKSYPTTTNIACFWCTEQFTWRPVSLPIKYENNIFYVDGCFCSPECASAYNFDICKTSEAWERYTLLNLLYIKMIDNKQIKIKLAPPRRTLIKFGGILSIEQFRKFNDNYYKQYDLVMPPVISVLPDLEKFDLNNEIKKRYDYIPIDKERIKQVSDDLILRRSKPINKFRNTLENCMSLKYINI